LRSFNELETLPLEGGPYAIIIKADLLHLIENTFDQKRIYANPSSYPNRNSNPNTIPNPNSNPKAQLSFRTDKMTSFFNQV